MARYDKEPGTLEEMIEALKMLIHGEGDEKLKISTDLFKYAMMNNGEKMLEH